MEISDLQKDWKNQGFGSKHKDLVVQMFLESRKEKVNSIMKKVSFFSVLWMFYTLLVIVFSWIRIVENWGELGAVIPFVLLLILSFYTFYHQVSQLQKSVSLDFSKPVLDLQKGLERLKVKRVQHNRFIFCMSNLYFWLMVGLVFNWNTIEVIQIVWQNAAIVVVIHLGFAIAWIPIAYWILSKYDSKNKQSKFWEWLGKDSQLTDSSVNFSLNNAMQFLGEIDSFEAEQ